ncbi:hypothetical protein ERO13_A06G017400v2 [Gossypium hirsutum]|uniref:BRI1 kinase inhibitor 1 n=3 Tax=Gossypium TaxID=3633 RepID=A0A1U8MUL3_GOSHI|nr:BRI1 kinase inhibitor 1-like [Gossypium hirsutum]KAB2076119.1 hypothetical protein ES319_A06G019100v1 [Gossypium barbadense]KAG4193837.1 hypothetical protein ERO13_A06G017400v2 [Gossypium hirsutum]TYJ28698.1 hypothetical protein E1A91_A06G018300v1 [Gossypium mustelinum]
MDNSHHQQHQQNTKESSSSTTDNQQQQPSTAAAAAAAAVSSSSSSSPSHEFSFAISLNNNTMINTDKAKTPPSSSSSSSIAIDLTPADDIFFHGHLLPLHLLSHLSTISPRSSTDSFTTTLPVPTSKSDSNIKSTNHGGNNKTESTRSKKSKSFSLFSFNKRQQKRVVEDDHKEKNNKRKIRFDVSAVLKRYLKMVKPVLFFKGKKRDNELYHVHRQVYSFSGNLSTLRNRKSGDHQCSSAPVSMRTSPTNSGLLVPTASDSTMEELQAAIQAAIAHCKNSIRGEDKLQC